MRYLFTSSWPAWQVDLFPIYWSRRLVLDYKHFNLHLMSRHLYRLSETTAMNFFSQIIKSSLYTIEQHIWKFLTHFFGERFSVNRGFCDRYKSVNQAKRRRDGLVKRLPHFHCFYLWNSGWLCRCKWSQKPRFTNNRYFCYVTHENHSGNSQGHQPNNVVKICFCKIHNIMYSMCCMVTGLKVLVVVISRTRLTLFLVLEDKVRNISF